MQGNPYIPRVPNHSGQPQSGQSYQYGDPGAAIGTLLSITSTFGQPLGPFDTIPSNCTFVGTEGIARATLSAMEIVRFADAPYLLFAPQFIDPDGKSTTYDWVFLDMHYRPRLQTNDRQFGLAAEKAHVKYLLPQLVDSWKRGEVVRFFGGKPRYIAVTGEHVEVCQWGRGDTVRASDLTVIERDNDLVLQSSAFYEAVFFGAETANTLLLKAFLSIVGAKAH